jgi:hypothetical protein
MYRVHVGLLRLVSRIVANWHVSCKESKSGLRVNISGQYVFLY